jgi:hypothetical protein
MSETGPKIYCHNTAFDSDSLNGVKLKECIGVCTQNCP